MTRSKSSGVIATIDVSCEHCGRSFSYEQEIVESAIADTEEALNQKLRENLEATFNRFASGDFNGLNLKPCQCGHIQSWMVNVAKREQGMRVGCLVAIGTGVVSFGLLWFRMNPVSTNLPDFVIPCGTSLFLMLLAGVGSGVLVARFYSPNANKQAVNQVKLPTKITIRPRQPERGKHPAVLDWPWRGRSERVIWWTIEGKQPEQIYELLYNTPVNRRHVKGVSQDPTLLNGAINYLIKVLTDSKGYHETENGLGEIVWADDDFLEREKAARVLAQIGKPAVPHLIEVLRMRGGDPAQTRFRYTILALGEIGPEAIEATAALMEALEWSVHHKDFWSKEMGSLITEVLNKIHQKNIRGSQGWLDWWREYKDNDHEKRA
jgi:hypothetical protein